MALPGEMCPVKLFPGEWCPVKLFPGEMCPVTCRKGVFDDRVVEACVFEKMSLMKDKMLADLFFTGFDSGLSPTTQADKRHMLLQQCPFPPMTCRKGVFDDRVVEACAFEKMSLMKDKMHADFFHRF